MRSLETMPVGAEWQCSSIWGRKAGNGQFINEISPLDGTLIQKIPMIDSEETKELLRVAHPLDRLDGEPLRLFCSRLHDELNALHESILEATKLETGFNRRDCEEVVQSCLEYVKGFPDYYASLTAPHPTPLGYTDTLGSRQIQQIEVPWGTIAVILPQSAFLFLAITCLLNALVTGNRVILRAPVQSARSAALLGLAIEYSKPPTGSVSIVMISARTFIATICESEEPILVHYLGSSAHAPDLIKTCFQAGKQVLIDGEGNTWVWVDENVPIDRACDILTEGALRYNGQTCTSINGAIIHPKIYRELSERLAARWNDISAGNPLEADVEVGPVLDEAQAEHCLRRIRESNATILAGCQCSGNVLIPTLAAEPLEESDLVSHGLFGPAMWIAPGDFDDFSARWRRNCYPLCAGVLTASNEFDQYLRRLPNLARLVVNADPSAEYMYEPWGGYPGTGTNTVSHWHQKYLRNVQVDSPS